MREVNCLSVFILYPIATIFHCSASSFVMVFPIAVYLCCLVYTEGRQSYEQIFVEVFRDVTVFRNDQVD
jgi:hypothetical protein